MSNESVSKALEEARALVKALENFDGTPTQHMTLLKQSDAVRTALEQPYDTITRWLENMSAAGALYILTRMKAFEKLPATGSITAVELAKQCNADVSIVTRAMRMLIVNGIVVETAPDEYANNAISLAMQPTALGGFNCVCVDFIRTWGAIPDYIKTHEPDELYDNKKSPFAFAMGHEGKTYYEVISLDPEYRHLWNLTMQNMEQNFPILGMFDFKSVADQVKNEPDRPFFVDVAGGRGQASRAIQAEVKDSFEGKMILQDLPIVIDTLNPEELPGIELMKYDFFTPQPVKNAHVYLMRRVLHDYYDPVILKFLKNTVAAMGPTSRLIICDMLIPEMVEVGAPMEVYWLDLSLLTISGKERTMAEFKGIFDIVGLELVKLYRFEIGHVVMLETMLKK